MSRVCVTCTLKFANYWGDDGHFDSVEILAINDATARTAALQSGQVHLINRLEPKIAGLLSRAPGVSSSVTRAVVTMCSSCMRTLHRLITTSCALR